MTTRCINWSGKRVLFGAVAFVGTLIGVIAPTYAHHGGAVDWQSVEAGPVTGVVSDFVFRFPHVVIYMDVAVENGETEQWALNTRWTPTILRQGGWSRNSVEPGDTVTVRYRPHVSDPTVVTMLTLEVNGENLSLDF
jgi:hypothetical protein